MQSSFIMNSGERYCLLVDEFGLPEFYPNLFITTQVRNRSLSYASMESALSCISVLNDFLRQRNENIVRRFRNKSYFNLSELDAIRDHCQTNFSRKKLPTHWGTIPNILGSQKDEVKVTRQTEYVRLTVIANYIRWLAEHTSRDVRDKGVMLQIIAMEKGLKSRRPQKRSRNIEGQKSGLSSTQLDLLFEIFRPGSPINPFKCINVQIRNRLMFLMLYHLGLRSGELLNIRVRDITFSDNEIVVSRRADEKDDPRTHQPLVKTLDRRLPIKESLVKEIHNYVSKVRRNFKNSSTHDYLFVTHKSGPTQGHPLSKSSYKKIMYLVREVSPSMQDFTGHQLRHTWNDVFSSLMDSMDDSLDEEQQEKIRSYLMGWREGSGTAATYNKRFIKRKAHEASITLQEGMTRVPRGLDHI